MTPSAHAVDLETYRSQGYLFEPVLLDAGEVETCLRRLDKLLAEPPTYGNGPGDAPLFEYEPAFLRGEIEVGEPHAAIRRVHGLLSCGQIFAALASRADVLARVRWLLGSDPQVVDATAILSPPYIGSAEMWRQEAARFQPPPSGMVSVRIALDDATEENGCMLILRRSHRDGLTTHERVNGHWLADATQPDLALLGALGRPALLPAGGAVFFDGLLLHSSAPNTGPETGRAIQLDFVPAGEHLGARD